MCLDKWKEIIEKGDCLVYSFGLADDWSFEETLADMGCTVRGFDPTVDEKPKSAKSERITFEKIGLSHKTGKTQVNIKIVKLSKLSNRKESLAHQFRKQYQNNKYLKHT